MSDFCPMVFTRDECEAKEASLTKFMNGLIDHPSFDENIIQIIVRYSEYRICMPCNKISVKKVCCAFVCGDYVTNDDGKVCTYRACDKTITICHQKCGFWMCDLCPETNNQGRFVGINQCSRCNEFYCKSCSGKCAECYDAYCMECFRFLQLAPNHHSSRHSEVFFDNDDYDSDCSDNHFNLWCKVCEEFDSMVERLRNIRTEDKIRLLKDSKKKNSVLYSALQKF